MTYLEVGMFKPADLLSPVARGIFRAEVPLAFCWFTFRLLLRVLTTGASSVPCTRVGGGAGAIGSACFGGGGALAATGAGGGATVFGGGACLGAGSGFGAGIGSGSGIEGALGDDAHIIKVLL